MSGASGTAAFSLGILFFTYQMRFPPTRLPATAHPSKFWLGGVEENWERMASGAESLIGSMRLSVKDGECEFQEGGGARQ